VINHSDVTPLIVKNDKIWILEDMINRYTILKKNSSYNSLG